MYITLNLTLTVALTLQYHPGKMPVTRAEQRRAAKASAVAEPGMAPGQPAAGGSTPE